MTKKIEEKDPSDYIIHITILGHSGSGKTSFLRRLKYDTFTTHYTPTMGFETSIQRLPGLNPYKEKLRDMTVHVHFSEFSGDDRFSDLAIKTAINDPIIMLMYDCQDPGSFVRIEETYKRIQEMREWKHHMVVLVASKDDKNIEKLEISHHLAKSYADSKNWLFLMVSARDMTQEVLQEKMSRVVTACLEIAWNGSNTDEMWKSYIPAPFVSYEYISQ